MMYLIIIAIVAVLVIALIGGYLLIDSASTVVNASAATLTDTINASTTGVINNAISSAKDNLVGKPLVCPSGYTQNGLMCAKVCPTGWETDPLKCRQNCPTGWRTGLLYCENDNNKTRTGTSYAIEGICNRQRPSGTAPCVKEGSRWYYTQCPPGYTKGVLNQCRPKCADGSNQGVLGCPRKTIDRDNKSLLAIGVCPTGYKKGPGGALCYKI